jgi:fatty acid desaturase
MEDWVAKRGLSVIDPKRLKELSRRSDAKGLIQWFSHLGAIAVSGGALALTWGSWWALPVFLIHGVLINCLYAGHHEMTHWTAFKTRRLNDIFGAFTGFVSIYPFYWDRWFHFAHHRHTMIWGKDAELLARGPYDLKSYLLYASGLTYWYGRIRRTFLVALGSVPDYASWLNEEQRRTVIIEARCYMAGYLAIIALSVVFQSWIAVIFWIGPMFATKAFHQLQNLGEHTMLAFTPDTLENTRTLKGPAVMRWLMWNMSFHTAHHTFPGVPFHALPALHKEIEAGLGHPVPSAGYLEAQRIILRALLRGPEPV